MTFDTLLVGAGPGNLLEAVLRARQGEKVVVVEKSGQFGGAWYTRTVLGMNDIECGPHFFQSEPEIDRLAAVFDLRTVPVARPHWTLAYGGKTVRLGDRLARLVLCLRALRDFYRLSSDGGGRAPSDDREQGLREIGAEALRLLTVFREGQRYFHSGCGPFIRTLVDAAARHGVELRRDASVQRLSLPDDGVSAVMAEGSNEAIKARRVLLTRRSVVDEVVVGQQILRPQLQTAYRTQIHFIVEGERPDFYLHRFLGLSQGGQNLFALVNLSAIYSDLNLPAGQSLLCMTVANMRAPLTVDDAVAEGFLARFIGLGVVKAGTRLIRYEASFYDDRRSRSGDLRAIERASGGRIALHGNLDLAVLLSGYNRDPRL